MDFDYLEHLKASHPTLRLLTADNGPLIISFLFKIFVEPNRRSVPQQELETLLGDYLYQLHDILGKERFPRSAREYLEAWAAGESGFLRKYYPDIRDEPEYDLTPATARAVEWLQSLEERRFVGTESRLLAIFELLKDIVDRTEQDPETRIRELEKRRAAIDSEIELVREQGVAPYDPTQVKERFFQAEDTARRLLADFRQVEYNFRALDRQTRERIATSSKVKGALLDEIFHDRDVIRDSDQGKSFKAFWELLMSPDRQQELQTLLDKLYAIEEIEELQPDPLLARIRYLLLDAGEKAYKTANLLVEQLRKFLDDRAYLENKRIMEIIRRIEKQAMGVQDSPPPERNFTTLDELSPRLELVMCRSLFTIPKNPVIEEQALAQGSEDIAVEPLYEQVYVDEKELAANIRAALQDRDQISLAGLVRDFPVRKGVAEVVAYLDLAEKDDRAIVDSDRTEAIVIATETGETKQLQVPRIIFVR
ncbi:MAG: DUF3375 domain-containing protein [Desulfobacterales bacterium]|nr:DUF3375 domain-containing protein [Desulfobacterales bacterium]